MKSKGGFIKTNKEKELSTDAIKALKLGT